MHQFTLYEKFKECGKNRALSLSVAISLSLLLTFSQAQAAYQLTDPQISVFEHATENDRVHFLIDRAKLGQGELITALLKRFPLQGPHAINRTLFIQGLVLAAKKDLTGAAKKYRAALANDPKLTLVRSELAQTLVALDENDSAKHHLQLLEADAPSPAVATRIRSFIEKIDARRPLTFSGFVSIAPSTNINNGSNHDTVYSANPDFADNPNLNISTSKKKSGVGFSGGASVGYSKRLGNSWEAVLAGDIGAQIYADPNYDSVSFSQSLEMRYHLDQGYLGFGGVADQSLDPNARDLINDSVSYHSYGPRVSMRYNLGQRDVVTSSAMYEWRDYAHADYLSGTAFLSDVAWAHAIDSSLNIEVSGGYTKVNSNEIIVSYGTVFGGFSIYKELPMGVTVNTSAQVRLSSFDAENIIAGVTRQDQRYIGGIALTKRDLNIMGFAPTLAYSYTLNKSNIALWDYDSHAVDFRLTKDF